MLTGNKSESRRSKFNLPKMKWVATFTPVKHCRGFMILDLRPHTKSAPDILFMMNTSLNNIYRVDKVSTVA